MMKSIFSLATVSVLVYFLVAVSTVWAVPHKEVDIGVDQEPFDLYFSEEKVIEATSRYPKALSRIAENVTTITAADIESAHVHTLAEIINRAAGVFVAFDSQDFGSSSRLLINGTTSADNHHTLVLVDGVEYNTIAGGTALTNGIPVSIIKRIEIVKGPASSAWGSALGGVINIITVDADDSRIHGKLTASMGEAESSDIRGEGSGGIKEVNYYLYGGKQDSEGLKDNRFFRNENYYGKVKLNLPHKSEFVVTALYTQPEIKYYDYYPVDLSAQAAYREYFFTANLNSALSDQLSLAVSAKTFSRMYLQDFYVLGAGTYGPAGDPFQKNQWHEDRSGVEGRLVWAGNFQTVALGLDFSRNELDQEVANGPFMQSHGLSAEMAADPAAEEQWAFYVNDTIEAGRIAVTPGLRYDWHSISDDFISPSIGVVYKYREDFLLRGSISRGFSAPFLSFISGGGTLFTRVNPELKPETVWSFQGGLETASLQFCRIKATLFFHKLRDIWERDATTLEIVNSGKNERTGFEVELETIPFHNLTLLSNLTSVYERAFNEEDDDHFYNVNIIFRYAPPGDWHAELFGHYVWYMERSSLNGRYDDFLWNLNISKKIPFKNRQNATLFFVVHNLFNGSQYWGDLAMNPDRWVEAGASFSF